MKVKAEFAEGLSAELLTNSGTTVAKVEQSYMANLKSYLQYSIHGMIQSLSARAISTSLNSRGVSEAGACSILSLCSFDPNFRVSPETVTFYPFPTRSIGRARIDILLVPRQTNGCCMPTQLPNP
jgi:hypothetical protein